MMVAVAACGGTTTTGGAPSTATSPTPAGTSVTLTAVGYRQTSTSTSCETGTSATLYAYSAKTTRIASIHFPAPAVGTQLYGNDHIGAFHLSVEIGYYAVTSSDQGHAWLVADGAQALMSFAQVAGNSNVDISVAKDGMSGSVHNIVLRLLNGGGNATATANGSWHC